MMEKILEIDRLGNSERPGDGAGASGRAPLRAWRFMRWVCGLASAAVLVATPVSASAEPSAAATASPTAAHIERDLVLKVKRVTPAVIKPNGSVKLSVSLRNTSRKRTHLVVKPGDGSSAGWREPHVYYTAEIDRGKGTWEPVAEATVGRCGLFDADWVKDVVALGPGKSLALADWIDSPDLTLQLDQPGKVRIFVHYAYRPSRKKSSQVKPSGPIAQVPDYEIVSKPIEITIE